jgi:hypothetical protein
MRPIRLAASAPDAEEVAVTGSRAAALVVLPVQIDEHLHLDAARVARPLRRHRVGPDKETGVSDVFRVDVQPIELANEVLVLLLRPQKPGGPPRRHDHVVLDIERVRMAIDVDPAGEVFAVEHGTEAVVVAGWTWCGQKKNERMQHKERALDRHSENPHKDVFEYSSSIP